MLEPVACLRVDKDDLEQKTWTCSKYKFLQNGKNTDCQSVFDNSRQYRAHMRNSHALFYFPERFCCPIEQCKDVDKKFRRIPQLVNHYDAIHRAAHNFKCGLCEKTFSCKKTWSRHVKNCNSGLLECEFCQRRFTGHSSLSMHCRKFHEKEINKDEGIRNPKQQPNLSNVIFVDSNGVQHGSFSVCLVPSTGLIDSNKGKRRRVEPTLNSQEVDSSEMEILKNPNDNICTQTDEFWYNEFSTQTDNEHSSFGTQTGRPNDEVLDGILENCDLVEYLDGEVQTDLGDFERSSFASQTGISAVDCLKAPNRLDRDSQTLSITNSICTQTKLCRERSLVVVDGLNSQTQTHSPQNTAYHETFTQTSDLNS